MKNKELVTELAARMGWTAQEVAETLSVLSSVVSSRLVDNDTIYSVSYTHLTLPTILRV